MKDAKFTKGPWSVRSEKIGVVDKSDTQSYGMMMEIAYIDLDNFDEDQCDANANLIAAAPDMYAMLKRFLPYVTHDEFGEEVFHGGEFQWNEDDDPMIDELKEVLAKARGEL